MKKHVVATVEIESHHRGTDKTINKYLKLGWVLINDIFDLAYPAKVTAF